MEQKTTTTTTTGAEEEDNTKETTIPTQPVDPSVAALGYYLTDKKYKGNRWEGVLARLAELSPVRTVRIDLQRSLDDQGPFQTILHKVTDELVTADEPSLARLHKLETYLGAHPSIVNVVAFENQRLLTNRCKVYETLREVDGAGDGVSYVSNPKFMVIEQQVEDYGPILQEHNIQFPVMAKPLPACGTAASHQMGVYFNAKQLQSCATPFLVQEYFNHGGVIFKVFIFGADDSSTHVVRRPSIRNFTPEDKATRDVILFDSQKPFAADLRMTPEEVADETALPNPPMIMLHAISKALRAAFGCQLLGVDVIRNVDSPNTYAVVDVNYFPTYGGVPQYEDRMARYLLTISKT
eukprot:TRINITY_DN896_c0_g1_i1.p1 TRINITY_DN896_c0_g1~~TRINITY_DN896_c0_g1_i1.p1  ORF type:complete len:371 (-),score=80.70 TRINITY_DN896_c0_g1_i1:53-1108(-)